MPHGRPHAASVTPSRASPSPDSIGSCGAVAVAGCQSADPGHRASNSRFPAAAATPCHIRRRWSAVGALRPKMVVAAHVGPST